MTSITEHIIHDLKKHIDPAYILVQKNFFKEPITIYGVRSINVKHIANIWWKKIPKETDARFAACERLLELHIHEPTIIAFMWAEKMEKQLTPTDLGRFEQWIDKYVANWAACDTFCVGALGKLLYRNPDLLPTVFSWTASTNRWKKRASAVALIYSSRRAHGLRNILQTAEKLLHDPDDMVQKGYGWMLKEATKKFQHDIFSFVMPRKDTMPRTALRYAIEKLPLEMKKEAMARDTHSRKINITS